MLRKKESNISGILCFAILFFFAGFSLKVPAATKVTGFLDSPKGVTLGSGTYYHWLPNDNKFDPIPALAPAGTTVTGSENQFLLPSKLGAFIQKGKIAFEGYFRYMPSLRRSYTATGTQDGTGYITFGSYGAGLNLGVAMLQRNRFQINFVLNGELVFQRATASFSPTAGGTDTIKIKSTSNLAGIGFQPEIWLGDMWTLSIFAGYQYGFLKYWEVEKAATFMGDAKTVGALVDSSGQASKAQFGGFLFEATLNLSFQGM